MHREQHAGSEREFWASHTIDPHLVALALWGIFAEHGMDGQGTAARMILTRHIIGIGEVAT
jgi:hypothetical protein